MSDDERLHYTGATTGHEGTGEKPAKLAEASIDDLLGDQKPGDLQPGVGTAAENHSPKE